MFTLILDFVNLKSIGSIASQILNNSYFLEQSEKVLYVIVEDNI